MNIILTGYRGTGKSAVAKVLSKRLGWPVRSLDGLIVEKAGKTIPEIVAESGWEAFRDLETEVVLRETEKDGQILDTGGGAILRSSNREALRKTGVVFWLRAQPATILERIGGDDQRPSLSGIKSFTEEVEEVLEQRTPIYREAAHFVVDTDGLSVEEVASEVLLRLKEQSPDRK